MHIIDVGGSGTVNGYVNTEDPMVRVLHMGTMACY